MAAVSFTNIPPSRTLPTTAVPDTVIDLLLGRGSSYEDWQRDIEAQHYVWSESLKNRIIKREYLRFKPEIALLLPINTNGSLRTRSNSNKGILKRLKGKTGERAQRLRNGTLFGSDAKPHTLETYVRRWRIEDPSFGLATSGSPPVSGTMASTSINTPTATCQQPSTQGYPLSPVDGQVDHVLSSVSTHLHSPALTGAIDPSQEVDALQAFDMNDGEDASAFYLNEETSRSQDRADKSYEGLDDSEPYVSRFPQTLLPFSLDLTQPSHVTEPRIDSQTQPDSWAQQHYGFDQGPLENYPIDEDMVDWNGVYASIASDPIPVSRLSQSMSSDISKYFQQLDEPPKHQDGVIQGVETSDRGVPQSVQRFEMPGDTVYEGVIGHPKSFSYRSRVSSASVSRYLSQYHSSNLRSKDFKFVIETRLRHRIMQLEAGLRKSKKELESAKHLASQEREQRDVKILELEEKVMSLDISSQQATRSQNSSRLSFNGMEVVVHQDSVVDQLLQRRLNDEMAPQYVEEARAAKQRFQAWKATNDPSQKPPEGKKDGLSNRRRFSGLPVPLELATGSALNATAIRAISSHGSTENTGLLLAPIFNTEKQSSTPGASTCSRSGSDTSTGGPFRQLIRKISNPLLRKQAPDVPPLPPSPIRRQWAYVHDDVKKRLTNDSGYASFEFGGTPRSSGVAAYCD